MSYSLSKKFAFGSLLLFALPTTIMMMVMSLYTIADGIFVSRFVGTNALSSINIVFPLLNILIGLGIMLSMGSSAIVARKMGAGDSSGARETFTAIIVLNVILGVVLAILGNLFAEPAARMLGASEVLLADCVTYLKIQMTFSPALLLQLQFQAFFVSEGKPGIGLLLTLLAGCCNVILDYLLIVPMGLGIAGAAIATVTGYMIPAVIGLIYFTFCRRSLWFTKFRFHAKELWESCSNGSSEMVTNLSSGVTTFLFNLIMMKFAAEDGVAAITIIQYAQFLLGAMYIGFSQGIAPVISFNYGSQNHRQLKQVYRSALTFISISSLFVFTSAELLGPWIVEIFAKPGTSVYEMARNGFALFSINFLFAGVNIFSSALFTALSDGKTSAFLSLVRTFGMIILCLLFLPKLLGVNGVWLAVPIAEACSLFMCIFFLNKYKSTYHYA